MRKLLALVAAVVAASPALGAQAVAVSVEDLARTSDAVVRGRVLSTSARWTEGRIQTYAEVEVAASLRGAAPARVTVVTPGGVVGELGQRVDGAATFSAGEQVVLFLSRPGRDGWRVSEMGQGKFTVEGSEVRPDTARTHFVATQVRAGERRSEAMSLAELERRVRSVP